jgi:hypothetical protein
MTSTFWEQGEKDKARAEKREDLGPALRVDRKK